MVVLDFEGKICDNRNIAEFINELFVTVYGIYAPFIH